MLTDSVHISQQKEISELRQSKRKLRKALKIARALLFEAEDVMGYEGFHDWVEKYEALDRMIGAE